MIPSSNFLKFLFLYKESYVHLSTSIGVSMMWLAYEGQEFLFGWFLLFFFFNNASFLLLLWVHKFRDSDAVCQACMCQHEYFLKASQGIHSIWTFQLCNSLTLVMHIYVKPLERIWYMKGPKSLKEFKKSPVLPKLNL